ncbi:MAG TPA: hypothetical protein VGW35_08515, partial [Methylomirabilota bacterium]|nr:hypothetical protein [Methylomirabilota bacterium]
FAATGSPAALDRVKRVLGGVKRLFDVTQDAAVRFEDGHRTRAAVQYAGIFARSALSPSTDGHGFSEGPLSSRPCYYEAPEGGWDVVAGGRTFHYAKFSAIPPFQLRSATAITPVGKVWYGFGCGSYGGDHAISRDQYTGVMMGLAYAYALVPDADVRRTAKKLIEQTLDHLLENHWTVVLPPENRAATFFIGNFDQQLAFLLIGRLVNPGKYGPRYDRDVAAAGAAWLPTWFSVLDPVPKYYKFNLAHAGGLLPLFLETDETRRAGYLTAYRMLRKATRHHRSAYFNLSRILIELPARRASVALEPSGSNPQLTLKDEIRSILADFLERRRLLLPAGGTGIPRNFVADPKYQVRRWPNDVAVYRPLEGGGKGYQVTFAMPPTGRIGGGMDYMWEVSPFGYALKFGDPRCSVGLGRVPTEEMIRRCGSDLNREGPGVDYLLAYWLGVYLGVVPRP